MKGTVYLSVTTEPTPTVLQTESDTETRELARRIGAAAQAGDFLCLYGPMGAGKTTFTQGLAQGLGVDEPVSSPTFALVHEYAGRTPIWHLDTYRIQNLDELLDLSWDDLLAGHGVVVIEWPERIAEALPHNRLDVRIDYAEGEARRLGFEPHGERAQQLLQLAVGRGSRQSEAGGEE